MPVVLELPEEERQVLTGWARGRTTAQALTLRSKIVLECAGGRPDTLGDLADLAGVRPAPARRISE